jgi:ribosomal protein L29
MSKVRDERREIREMTIDAALHDLAIQRRQMFDLRMQSARGEVKNVRQFAETRKRIARLMFKLHMESLYPSDAEFIEAEDDEETLPVAETEEEIEAPVADDDDDELEADEEDDEEEPEASEDEAVEDDEETEEEEKK